MQIEMNAPAIAELHLVLDMLFEIPGTDIIEQRESFLAAADRGEVSLDGLRVARVSGQIVGAVLAVCQPDGTAHVWPPRLTANAPPETGPALAQACCQWIEGSGVSMAQCLTRLDDHAAHQLLEHLGFEGLADLVCWQHDLEDIPVAIWPEACETVGFSQLTDEHFERVIQQTYAGSQDCPRLHGRRSARDSLTAHQLAANDDSTHWRLYRRGAEDVGVVLCVDPPDQRMWELLYMGVVPKFRQRGFSLAMLCETLLQARNAGAQGVFLAADAANDAAANLYVACGFLEDFRQRIHVWFPPPRT